MLCEICYEEREQLYSLSDCQHKFCKPCCIEHINSKSLIFTTVLCPHPECHKPLDKNSQIFKELPKSTTDKIKKYEEMRYLQSNPHLKPCSKPNCKGVINSKQAKRVCNACKTAHCPKCMKEFHNGNCIIDEHDAQMKKANFQKCPNCSIWVQKKQGCTYIDCKCGTAFCYTCGAVFADDPCRRKQQWRTQDEIRNILKTIKLGYNITSIKVVNILYLIIIKLPLIAILFTGLTLAYSLGVLLLMVFTLSIVAIMSPGIAMAVACDLTKDCCALFAIILWPILVPIAFFFLIFLFLMYPVFRNYYHHGIYDGLQNSIIKGTKSYLECVSALVR